MLRDSSLRPDLVGLLDALKTAPALASRLMLTNDGSMPAFLRTHGFIDHLIRVALEHGVPPIDAYRMATLNPATYYGLDAELGGIAPGRYADLCVLDDLAEPRPSTVIARGRVVATGGLLVGPIAEPPWRRVFSSPKARLTVRWRARPDDFELPGRASYPVIELVSAVISRLQERPMQPGDLHAALLDRGGRWVAPGVVAGFADRIDGFATTTSTDFNILALGRRREAMARAVNRLLDLHGGIVLVEGERIVYELALPLGGIMTRASVGDAPERGGRASWVPRALPGAEAGGQPEPLLELVRPCPAIAALRRGRRPRGAGRRGRTRARGTAEARRRDRVLGRRLHGRQSSLCGSRADLRRRCRRRWRLSLRPRTRRSARVHARPSARRPRRGPGMPGGRREERAGDPRLALARRPGLDRHPGQSPGARDDVRATRRRRVEDH